MQLILIAAVAVMSVMLLLWLLGLKQRNFSYVDIGWAANFALLAAISVLWAEGYAPRRWLIASMYALWGGRRALHLAARIIGEPEEGRYTQLRREWGAKGHLNLRFLLFFEFQAALNLILAIPLMVASINTAPHLNILEIVGAFVWAVALCGETIADRQLQAFKRQPVNRGKVCDVGLWGWSRHPNYFFEWLIWIGYAVFALASPYGAWALPLPLLMLHFLINVTGVKATEEQALRSKGEAYRNYQRTVSVFIPRPRKKEPV